MLANLARHVGEFAANALIAVYGVPTLQEQFRAAARRGDMLDILRTLDISEFAEEIDVNVSISDDPAVHMTALQSIFNDIYGHRLTTDIQNKSEAIRVIQMLLMRGADPDIIIDTHHIEWIEQHYVEIAQRTHALHVAAAYNDGVFEIMIDYGTNIGAIITNNDDILHCCVRHLNLTRVVKCLERGADPNALVDGDTALHVLMTRINAPHDKDNSYIIIICRYLMEHGADPEIKDNDGETPIDIAERSNVDESIIATMKCTMTKGAKLTE